jgi:hypothetical protein
MKAGEYYAPAQSNQSNSPAHFLDSKFVVNLLPTAQTGETRTRETIIILLQVGYDAKEY